MKGRYKTAKKFVGFVGKRGDAEPGDRALVDGRPFSHPGKTFEMVVHEDGSVDLSQVGADEFTPDELARFVQILDDRELVPMRGHWVVDGVVFTDPSGKPRRELCLSAQVVTPYNKLQDILSEPARPVSKKQAGRLAMLLEELSGDEGGGTPVSDAPNDVPAEPASTETAPLAGLAESAFERMKEEKMAELAASLAKADERINRHKHEVSAAEALLKSAEAEADLLRQRIKSLGVKPVPNGLLFHVSERLNEAVALDEDTSARIRGAISKVKSINAEAFMRIFSNGEYRVTLFRRTDDGPVRVDDARGLDGRSRSLLSSLSIAHDGSGFVYSGDMDWHSLVDRFACAGLEHLTSLPVTKDGSKKTK